MRADGVLDRDGEAGERTMVSDGRRGGRCGDKGVEAVGNAAGGPLHKSQKEARTKHVQISMNTVDRQPLVLVRGKPLLEACSSVEGMVIDLSSQFWNLSDKETVIKPRAFNISRRYRHRNAEVAFLY